MTRSPEEFIAFLADIIRTAPLFRDGASLTTDEQRWLGKAFALFHAVGNTHAAGAFTNARHCIASPIFDQSKLLIPLHDANAMLELEAPTSSHGAFIPPSEAFNGYAAIVSILKSAEKEALLIDPYVDAVLLPEIVPVIPEGVMLRCLTSGQHSARSLLSTASGSTQKCT